MTAVTNSAVESASTRAMSQLAGTSVRYGRIANPTMSQATTHVASNAPAYSAPSKSPPSAPASARPTRPPSAAPSRRILRITTPSIGLPGVRHAVAALMTLRGGASA